MEQIAIADVVVGVRYRKDFGDIESLANSLTKLGQIHPIVIDEKNELIAGERRLRAAMSLGWSTIGFTRKDSLDEISKKEIEIEENLRRKEFNWPEEVLALEQLYKLKQSKYGKRIQGSKDDTGFGFKDAAELFDKSVGSIHYDLELAQALHEFPELATESTKHAAAKRYKRMKEKALREEVARRQSAKTIDSFDKLYGSEAPTETPTDALDAGITPASQRTRRAIFQGHGVVFNGDSLLVTRYLQAGSVDLIITDPPYALGLFKEGQSTSGKRLAQHEGALYDDDPFRVMDMLAQVFANLNSVLKPNGHAYIFFHSTWYHEMYEMLQRAFDNQNSEQSCVDPTPLVWIKNSSGIGDPNQRYVYAYEPCFFINKGRTLCKAQPFNYLRYDTVPPQKKVHPTEKPTALFRHLIEASSVEGEMVLDCFAGSGSTLVAAAEMGRKFMGVELDPTYYLRIADRLALTLGAIEKEGVQREMIEAPAQEAVG